MSEVAAILLAAGRSRRMGAFKPLLPFGDTTVIETCVKNLRAAGAKQIVVVIGHRANEIRKHLKSASLRFAINPDPDSQMSASIACGLMELEGSAKAVLISLVDHPAVSSETIKLIIDQWMSGTRLIQPTHNGQGGHPVLIDLSYRDELLKLDREKGLRAFFEAHRKDTRRLPVESPYVARDLDTWEDYVTLHEEVFGRPPAVDLANFS